MNPWGVNTIDKNGADIFVAGEDGNLIDQGDIDDSTLPSTDGVQSGEVVDREPDDNGVDDPPVRRRRRRDGAIRVVRSGAGHGERLRPRR